MTIAYIRTYSNKQQTESRKTQSNNLQKQKLRLTNG